MKITIREALITDLDVMAGLFNDYRVFYKKEADLAGALQFIGDRMRNRESVIFLAEAGEVVCGYFQFYPLFSSTNMRRLWLLNDLFVSEGFRQMGIARLLLNKAKTFAIETSSGGFFLETAVDNMPANKLYQSVGLLLDNANNYYVFNTP